MNILYWPIHTAAKWPHLMRCVNYQLVNVISCSVFVTTHLKVVTDHIPCQLHKVPFQFIRILKSHPYVYINFTTTRKLLMDNSPPPTAPPTVCVCHSVCDVEGA